MPTGNLHAESVKANVLFFDRKPANPSPWTQALWIYDLRTNKRFTLKTNRRDRPQLGALRRAAREGSVMSSSPTPDAPGQTGQASRR